MKTGFGKSESMCVLFSIFDIEKRTILLDSNPLLKKNRADYEKGMNFICEIMGKRNDFYLNYMQYD